MKYSKFLMNEEFINVKGMWPLTASIVAISGVLVIATLMPMAYAFDKTEQLWQKVTR